MLITHIGGIIHVMLGMMFVMIIMQAVFLFLTLRVTRNFNLLEKHIIQSIQSANNLEKYIAESTSCLKTLAKNKGYIYK